MLVRGARKLARGRLRGPRGARGRGRASGCRCRDGLFDGALVAFGIRNVGDPRGGAARGARVLRPGGRFVVLEFSMPAGLLGAAYRLYFRSVLPRLGGLVSGDA